MSDHVHEHAPAHAHEHKRRRTGHGALAGLIAFLFLALLAWLALRDHGAPERQQQQQPLARDAPAQRFSAARALDQLAAMTQTPRPIASSANRRAREHIVGQLQALGYAPQVQRAVVQKNYVDYNANYEAIVGVVHNVLVRVQGTGGSNAGHPRPALLLAVYYDSERGSLGVARGGIPVAASLEMLRALRHGPAPANDVIVLFADGERAGSLGMQAFAEQHPWAREVGLALRFDGGGSGGPLILYNTRNANSAAIAGWRRAVPDVRGSSLMHEVHQLAPGALRIGALDRLGVPVLQFANTGLPLDRAGELDTLARLQPATLQHMGSAMLRLVHHFGQARLDPRIDGNGGGQVYFDLPFGATVHYSAALAWPLAFFNCLLLAGAGRLAWRQAGMRYTPFLQAAFVVPALAVLLGIGAWQLWMHVPALHRAWNPAAPRQALAYLLGVSALAAAFYLLAQRWLQRHTGAMTAALAALGALTAVLLLASWLAPGASYLLAWPLLAALACCAGLHAGRVQAWPPAARLALLVLGVAPAVVLVPAALRDSFLVLSPQRMNLPVAMLALLLGVSTLLLAAHARRYVARTLLLFGLGGLALAGSADETRETPSMRANNLVYYRDMPSWDAYWLKPAGPLDDWERTLFANLTRPHHFVSVFGWREPEQWYAWAPRKGLEFPFIRVLRNGKAPDRHADFTLASKNRAPEIRLDVINARVLRATMNGRTLLDKEAKTLKIIAYGMEDETLHFHIRVKADPIFGVQVKEIVPGLPEHLLPPRPANAPALIPGSGTSVAADMLWFY